MKKYHQQGAQKNNSNQGIDFIFGENNDYHQIGNAYLALDNTLRKHGNGSNNLDADGNIEYSNKLVTNVFAYALSVATLSTTEGEEIEVKKLGPSFIKYETFNN